MANFAGELAEVGAPHRPRWGCAPYRRQDSSGTLANAEICSPASRLGPPSQNRLKVIQVVEATFAGVGRHVTDLCAALVARGHEVHLAYSPVRMEKRFASAIAELAGLGALPLKLARAPSPSDARAILTLRRYMRARGPFHVVHGHSSKGGAIARIAAAGLCAGRVYTAHALRTLDPGLSRGERMLYETVERVLGRSLTAAFVGVAPEEVYEARRLGIAPERVHVVPNGIALPGLPDRALVRARYGLEDHHVCLMWVGRLAPQKAPDRFVRLVSSLAGQNPEMRALMIGSGPLELRLRELIRDEGLADRLQLVQDQDAVMSMPAADIYVMTSRYEGLPYVLLEAQSVGLPVVACDGGGLSTAVESGATGFAIAQGDEAGFSAALRRLISDAELRRDMSDAARRRAKCFRLDDMVDRIEALYFRLSTQGSSGGLRAT
jgi:glycosyltransferase involved in cell wall biosynthesis